MKIAQTMQCYPIKILKYYYELWNACWTKVQENSETDPTFGGKFQNVSKVLLQYFYIRIMTKNTETLLEIMKECITITRVRFGYMILLCIGAKLIVPGGFLSIMILDLRLVNSFTFSSIL